MTLNDPIEKVANVLGVAGSITTLISLAALSLLIAYLLGRHWLAGNSAAVKEAISSSDNDALARLLGGTHVPLDTLTPEDKFKLATEDLRVRNRQRIFAYALLFFGFLAILAFALVLALSGGDQPAQAAGPGNAAEARPSETATPDKLAQLLAKASLSTPLETYSSILGPPISVRTDDVARDVRNYRFEDDRGRLLQISRRGDETIGVAGYDPGSALPVPTLNACWDRAPEKELCFDTLADVNLTDILLQCDRKRGHDFGGRGGFHVGPCYFGRPGSYNYFTFLFYPDEKMDDECKSVLWRGEDEISEQWVRGCKLDQFKPVGFVVTSEGEEEDVPGSEKDGPDKLVRWSFVGVLAGDPG